VRLVVVLPNSSFAITRSFLSHLCVDLSHSLRQLLNLNMVGKDEAMVLLSEYKKKRDADKKKANFKTLGNNGGTSENRDGQTAYLTAENLGIKVMVLANTGSDYSAIPRSVVEDARKRGFPRKVEVLPEPIMLNMAIRGGATSRRAVRRRCSCQR
jgi:hypothetical protein